MIRRPQQLLILRIVSMNFIFPTLIYSLLDAHHISPLWSIFYSGIPPSVDAILYLLMERRIDAINCVVLIGTVVGCAFAIVTNDPAMMLLKDSIVTAVFGFGFLFSLFFSQNMIWWYNKTFNGQAPEDKVKLEKQWANDKIRNGTIVMTWVWGMAYVIEAIARIALLYVLPLNTMVYMSIAAPVVFTASLAAWSVYYVKQMFKRSKASEEVVSLDDNDVKLNEESQVTGVVSLDAKDVKLNEESQVASKDDCIVDIGEKNIM